MRIVAGSRKGARIAAPRGRDTRPTGDRVREAAFALVGPIEGARVLDLFAGSGAMGLEALSRGAAEAVLVERDPVACAVAERNVARLGLAGARVVRADARRFLAGEAGAGSRYDLVVVDPPYAMLERLLPDLAPAIAAVLAPRAVVLVESGSGAEVDLGLPLVTSRRYGAARLTLFRAASP